MNLALNTIPASIKYSCLPLSKEQIKEKQPNLQATNWQSHPCHTCDHCFFPSYWAFSWGQLYRGNPSGIHHPPAAEPSTHNSPWSPGSFATVNMASHRDMQGIWVWPLLSLLVLHSFQHHGALWLPSRDNSNYSHSLSRFLEKSVCKLPSSPMSPGNRLTEEYILPLHFYFWGETTN